jgi:FkbM family methyltransferase
MYSQNNEEEIILEYFSNHQPAKFIDIGGFHPTVFSNTRCLVERGWSGVYVEPSPICMKSFKDEYSENPNIILVQQAITDKTGKSVFFESSGDAVGTLDKSHKERWESVVKFNEIEIDCISMRDFLSEYFTDHTFISIDVEGINLTLFNLIPDYVFEKISLLCIEHEGRHDEILSRCSNFNFTQILLNRENLILAKNPML